MVPTPDSWLIHPERLSAKPARYEGSLVPGELPRLSEVLANGEGALHYRISARLDGQRRKVVSCIIEGFVFLTCQASLDPFRHPVRIEDRLVLVDDESGLPPIQEESDEEDYLVADEPLDLRELVEDAVILALPMVPRKPGLEGEAGVARGAEGDKPSAFAALEKLKRPRTS